MSRAYYNENDKRAAAWLRELIRENHIAPGDVDERSIEDAHPRDIQGYTQCHWFAGIGVWSYALRCAGWPDSRSVWTGSCPCQPFSAAGQGLGFEDERHLWPAWLHHIIVGRPSTLFGEQVASRDGRAWLDVVQADLEATGYACAPFNLAAAGVGAPHIRQRLFFVGDFQRIGAGWNSGTSSFTEVRAAVRTERDDLGPPGAACGMADSSTRLEGRDGRTMGHELAATERGGRVGALADGDCTRRQRLLSESDTGMGVRPHEQRAPSGFGPSRQARDFWSPCDWIACRDGKARPVEPGTFPLAHGAPARVGRLRGYGNAIVAPLAEEFIRQYMSL